MALAKVESWSGGDRNESLLFLTKLRCLTHGDAGLIQREGGQIVSWCGCVWAGEASEMRETDLNYTIVNVER